MQVSGQSRRLRLRSGSTSHEAYQHFSTKSAYQKEGSETVTIAGTSTHIHDAHLRCEKVEHPS